MKLIAYFDAFLDNEVNLNATRLDRLGQSVEAITSFLKGSTSFADHFVDVIPQGSYAHKTIIRPVSAGDEFDADILLEVTEVEGWDPKDYVEELYRTFRGNGTYKEKASRKTRCVKIDYAGDFHVDVVPYLERHGQKYVTNRHEDRFELTDPEAYNAWFDEKDRVTGRTLVKAIRLLKYLRDFKKTFQVKSIVLNALVGEQVSDFALLEEPKCYADVPTTLRTLMNGLSGYVSLHPTMPAIMDPSGTGENFGDRWHQEGYSNFRKWVMHYAGKIDAAYAETDKEASLAKWQEVFGDGFKKPEAKAEEGVVRAAETSSFDDTEQHIEKIGIPVELDPRFQVRLTGTVLARPGFRSYVLSRSGNKVMTGRKMRFQIAKCTVPAPYDIYWKVKNEGQKARELNQIRGQIEKGTSTWRIDESSTFRGPHYVECYIVKDGVCIAMDRQDVTIVPPWDPGAW